MPVLSLVLLSITKRTTNKTKVWIINEKPIGPKYLNKFFVNPLIRTVDGYPHGKPPNGE